MGMAKQQTPAKRENVAYSHLYVAYNPLTNVLPIWSSFQIFRQIQRATR